MESKYQVVIGLEIHLRLDTESKMFCGSRNSEGDQPNQHLCPICLGHPGTLPQLNAEALRLGSMLALALNCELALETKFDRKNYFYPDLPKGYQISQHDQPIAQNGYLDILPDDIHPHRVRIERLHLEEDAAKLKHAEGGATLVDLNRAGAPLVELVTRPDLRTPQEARIFGQEIQQIARYVHASQAEMEKGHLRIDANVSLRPLGDETLYPKTEVKNMNSFRSVERALQYEIERQTDLWENDAAPEQTTTRGWDDKRGITVEQRTKEGMGEYRFFPEPDLPPLVRTREEIDELRRHLPELPAKRRERFLEEYELSYADAKVLTADPRVGEFFEETISELRAWLNSLEDTAGSDQEVWLKYRKKLGRLTAAWITTELFTLLKRAKMDFGEVGFTAENFAELLAMVFEKKVNSSAGQQILKIMFDEGGDPSLIVRDHDLEQVSDEAEIAGTIHVIIESNPSVVEDYRNGKEKALMFLVGQLMRETKGKVNPEVATRLFKEKLG